MNIFCTDPCPYKSAQALDDKRVNKMYLESAQMLSTALHVCRSPLSREVYKPAWNRHPCTMWVYSSRDHYLWLLAHFEALGQEREKRKMRPHKSSGLLDIFLRGQLHIHSHGFLGFVNCASDYKHVDNVHDAYQLQLSYKWNNVDKRLPVWTNCKPPAWRRRLL